MINSIENNFLKFIQQEKLIKKGDGIVVGLSGGPDSVCLLYLLISIREKIGINIAAAHLNHMLRGKAADEDEEFAKRLCEKLNIEFFSKKVDINKYSKEHSLSSEAAGRKVRYEFFNDVMKKLNYNKIATAHNANDQAETVLMRMMRGAGLEGLCGIPVNRENKYIRPILFLKREEIENYCKEKGVKPRIDATNLERIYSRNKVRLDILPYMKENFNQDVIEAINRMSILLQEDNKFIDKEVNKIFNDKCKIFNKSVTINKEVFLLEEAVIKRVIRKSIEYVSGNKYDVELKHIEDVEKIQKHGTGKRINLPNNLIAINVYGDIKIKYEQEVNSNNNVRIITKSELMDNVIVFNDFRMEFKVVDNNENINYNKNSFIKYFNFDKINKGITIRYRKNGDRIIPIGLNGSKKVKDIFIDMKIPKEDRDSIPILEFDNNISWIVGIKQSDLYKIRKDTKKVLKISIQRKE